MRLRRAVGSLLICAFGSSACATAYVPRTSPRVQVVMQAGAPAYVRDGRVHESGFFGSGLVDAVQGNPEAESHARAFHNGQVAGLITALAGVASAGGGAALILANSARLNDERNSSDQAIGTTLLIGGIAAYIAGFVLILNAQPHQWDAINVYNDGLPDFSRGPVPLAYPAPPGGPIGPSPAPPIPGPPGGVTPGGVTPGQGASPPASPTVPPGPAPSR